MTLQGRSNPNIANLAPYLPGKPIDELSRELGITDIVKLASNENPRGPGPKVRAALAAATEDLSRYPDGNGFRLKSALADRFAVDMSQLTLGSGSNDVIDLSARVALEPGLEAVVPEHAFVAYRLAITAANATLVEVPASNYTADLDAMLAALTDNTRIIYLANPNNPTGTWVNQAALTRFLDAVPPRVWVLLDEAYAEFVRNPDYPNGVALLSRYPNLIVTRTFSKIYGLGGMRVGYGISSPEFADLMNRARLPFNVNALGLAAAEAALADEAFVEETRALNDVGLAQLEAGFQRMGLDYIPSIGNFLAVDVRRPGGAVFDALLKQGVIVRPIAEYGLPNHLRVSVGLEAENDRCLSALEQVLSA